MCTFSPVHQQPSDLSWAGHCNRLSDDLQTHQINQAVIHNFAQTATRLTDQLQHLQQSAKEMMLEPPELKRNPTELAQNIELQQYLYEHQELEQQAYERFVNTQKHQ